MVLPGLPAARGDWFDKSCCSGLELEKYAARGVILLVVGDKWAARPLIGCQGKLLLSTSARLAFTE